ncbi:MAG: type VI secretion system accessory protein TagJ [Pseudomonadota bacterium]
MMGAEAKTLGEMLEADALEEAISAAGAAVKAAPASVEKRLALADLLIVAGNYERAETHARLAATAAPDLAVGLGLLRQQLRGMFARGAWGREAALPEFPGGPSECDSLAVKLALAIRAGNAGEAAETLASLEAARGTRPATWNGEEVDDLRDLDDAIPHAIEVISTGGNYLWVDMARIAVIRFKPRESLRDLAYRRAALTLRDGAEAEVLIPAVYPQAETDAHRLARSTDWSDGPGGTVFGRGQRAYLVGDEMRGIHEAEEIVFRAGDAG